MIYNLTSWLEQIRSSNHYEGIQWYIDAKGFQEVKYRDITVNVFTAEMALFLLSSEVKCKTYPQGEEVTINGKGYFESFSENFKRGEVEFNSKYYPSFSERQNPSLEHIQYLRDQYFEKGYKGLDGWNFIEYSSPEVLSNSAIEKHGLYSGYVSAFVELLREHPNFHDALEQGKSTIELSNSAIVLLQIYQGKRLSKANDKGAKNLTLMLAEKYGCSSKDLYNKFLMLSGSKRNRIGLDTPRAISNRIKDIESILQFLDGQQLEQANSELTELIDKQQVRKD